MVVHDPLAIANARVRFPGLEYAEDVEDALQGADLVLHLTEWPHYRELDPVVVAGWVSRPRLIDGRNALDLEGWRAAGWKVRVASGDPERGSSAQSAPSPDADRILEHDLGPCAERVLNRHRGRSPTAHLVGAEDRVPVGGVHQLGQLLRSPHDLHGVPENGLDPGTWSVTTRAPAATASKIRLERKPRLGHVRPVVVEHDSRRPVGRPHLAVGQVAAAHEALGESGRPSRCRTR